MKDAAIVAIIGLIIALLGPATPKVTTITPAGGINNSLVRVSITGAKFDKSATVKLTKPGQPDIPAYNVQVVSKTQIDCLFDLTGKSTGAWNVVVSNFKKFTKRAKTGLLENGFTIEYPAPTLATVQPRTGLPQATVSLNIFGTGFRAGAQVQLAKEGLAPIQAQDVKVLSDTHIQCEIDLTQDTPAVYDLVVANDDGKSAVLSGGFEVTENGAPQPVLEPALVPEPAISEERVNVPEPAPPVETPVAPVIPAATPAPAPVATPEPAPAPAPANQDLAPAATPVATSAATPAAAPKPTPTAAPEPESVTFPTIEPGPAPQEPQAAVSAAPSAAANPQPAPEAAAVPAENENKPSLSDLNARLKPIYFNFDDAMLRLDQRPNLEANIALLKENPDLYILVGGNADERGTEDYNLKLSARRAATIRHYLIKGGIAPERIVTYAYGEKYPIRKGHSEAAWRYNRRADVLVYASRPTLEQGIRAQLNQGQ